MIFRRRNLVFLFAVAAFVCADQDTKQVQSEVDTAKEVTEPPQPAPSTDKPKPTTKPTTIPTTAPTTAPTTPTTAPTTPSTSTPAPTTPTTPSTPPTTSKPTPPPTTPTPPPTTPTPAPTTPTPAPTTPAPVKHDAWIVKGTNDTICIVAKMDILVRVPYKTIENKTVDSKFTINKVDEANATGSCSTSNNTETLVLTWHNATTTATFNFVLNATEGKYSINSVQIAIQVNNVTFPNNTMTNVTQVKLLHQGQLFSVGQNNSFSCAVVPALNMTGAPIPLSNNTLYGHLVLSNVHVQAFGQKSTSEFRTSMDCASTETPDIVPIVVGLILAGLVVVVLVAYLVGRRRARNNGYLSISTFISPRQMTALTSNARSTNRE